MGDIVWALAISGAILFFVLVVVVVVSAVAVRRGEAEAHAAEASRGDHGH